MDDTGSVVLDCMDMRNSSCIDKVVQGPHAQPEWGPHKPSQQVHVRICNMI